MSLFTMAGTAVANLFRKPATRLYPSESRKYPTGTRGRVEIDISFCTFCSLCQKKCPTLAITVQREARTWGIDRLKCIACGSCCDACPKECLIMGELYSKPVAAGERETVREVVKGA